MRIMTKKSTEIRSSGASDTIVVDKRYIRDQANQAFKLLVVPLSGIYDAAFGRVQAAIPSTPQKTKERA
jgi:hypothetical protein